MKMNDLPKAQQPRSDDPEFWGVWVGADDAGKPVSRETDWERIAEDWQAGQEGGIEGNEDAET